MRFYSLHLFHAHSTSTALTHIQTNTNVGICVTCTHSYTLIHTHTHAVHTCAHPHTNAHTHVHAIYDALQMKFCLFVCRHFELSLWPRFQSFQPRCQPPRSPLPLTHPSHATHPSSCCSCNLPCTLLGTRNLMHYCYDGPNNANAILWPNSQAKNDGKLFIPEIASLTSTLLVTN